MKGLLLILITIVIATIAFGQGAETLNLDSINCEQSDENFHLIGFTIGPCEGSLIYDKENTTRVEQDSITCHSIQSIDIQNDTITIDLRIVDNCCVAFIADVSSEKSNIVNLRYETYGVECGCGCCFGGQYVLKRKNNLHEEYTFQVNGETIRFGKTRITMPPNKD